MCKVIAVSLASVLIFTSYISHADETFFADNWHQQTNSASRFNIESHMFDGISLTEQQRQQMRDLMQRARHSLPPVNLNEIEAMHKLVTENQFDESAVRAQAEKMAQEQVERQVEMARVRHQMYSLLTPEQKAVLHEKHDKRMNALREIAELQNVSSEEFYSSNRSNQ